LEERKMSEESQRERDEIYEREKANSIPIIAFLAAIKVNLDHELAFKVALEGFVRMMSMSFKRNLSSTPGGSQERFDRFREIFQGFAEREPYCELTESTKAILRLKFTRCPLFEVMKDSDLQEFGAAYCLSDYTWTKNVLPGVDFSRNHEIVKGDAHCDHTWEFNNK
jgi:hypothetical protein